MAEVFIGTSALPEADVDRMKDAGIGWLRHGPHPFFDRLGGELNPAKRGPRDGRPKQCADFRLMGPPRPARHPGAGCRPELPPRVA